MKERFDDIGGIVRYLLAENIENYIWSRDQASDVKIGQDLNKLGVFNLPSQSKFYLWDLVPIPEYGTTFLKAVPNAPRDLIEQSNAIYEYRFLSEK